MKKKNIRMARRIETRAIALGGVHPEWIVVVVSGRILHTRRWRHLWRIKAICSIAWIALVIRLASSIDKRSRREFALTSC